MYFVALHVTALGHDIEEVLVATVYIALQVADFLGIVVHEHEVLLVVAEAVGLHAVKGDA